MIGAMYVAYEWFSWIATMTWCMYASYRIIQIGSEGKDATKQIRQTHAQDEYKDMIVDSTADDILSSSLFTGVHGNYLRPSVVRAGMDPENLATADVSSMDFSSNSQKLKSWKDIWGSGQGIGAVEAVLPAAELVDRLAREYAEAKAHMAALIADGETSTTKEKADS